MIKQLRLDCEQHWGKVMDAGWLNFVILSVGFTTVFFYVLYLVIRGAVRDGIALADERRTARESALSASGPGALNDRSSP